MLSSRRRIVLVAVLAALLAGGVAGLTVVLVRAHSASQVQLRRRASDRAELGAALINSALAPRLSSPAAHRTAAPPSQLGRLLNRYLGDLAAYGAHAPRTSVLLVDGSGRVIAGPAGAGLAAPLGAALRSALRRDAATGTFGPGGDRFFATAPVRATSWRVVYTLPTSVLYTSTGNGFTLAFVLLGGFAAAVAACLLLLIRLLAKSQTLARANAQLGSANAAMADANSELAERNRTAEQATAAKSRFVASMSHELRTPLNAVIGFAELMAHGRAGELSETQREYVGIISRSADHLLTLIDEVLEISKIEAGVLRLDPEAIDPVLVAQETVRSMEGLAAERRVTLRMEAEPAGMVALDPARLRQVMLNFLSNAIKFTGAGGRVTVSVARVQDRLLVAVTDTGIGISAEDQARIFDEFVQVGTGDRSGTGLGLAVARQIVEAQGGEVSVTSRLGFGSTFRAVLPCGAPVSAGVDQEPPGEAGQDAGTPRAPGPHHVAPRASRTRRLMPLSQRSG